MTPGEIARARRKWQHRGQGHPPFAEAPGPKQESVWDYPRPPQIRSDPRLAEVFAGDVRIAASTHTLKVCETASPPAFYFPGSAVQGFLRFQSKAESFCEWKGRASIWNLHVGDRVFENAAWSYPQPLKEFRRIRGWMAFHPGKLTCKLAGETVRPQPGGFYGGWLTPDIAGPVKGAPGTGDW